MNFKGTKMIILTNLELNLINRLKFGRFLNESSKIQQIKDHNNYK